MNFFDNSLSEKGPHILPNTYLFCESADNLQIFKKEKASSLEACIRKINEGLNAGKENLKVCLAKLLIVLPQCPQSILSSEGERWIRFCYQRLAHPESSVVKALLAVIKFVLRACHDNKELHSKVTKVNSSFIEKLCSVGPEVQECAFHTLYELLRLFPSQCLPHKKCIEEKLMRILSLPLGSNNADLVYAAAKVYAALPVPGGTNTVAEIKGGHLDQLISLGHCAADALFQSVQENESYQFSREHKLPLKNWESDDPMVRLMKSAPLLGNCFVFFKGFFEKCPFRSATIKPQELIRLSFRILQVEVASLKEKGSMELKALSFILPSLHMRAVAFLKVLVENKVCGLFMNLVEEQLVWSLKAANPSASKAIEDSSNHSLQQNISLRVLCYETLTQAIKVSKGNHTGLLEKILPTLLVDISPLKDSLSLNNVVRGGRLSLINVKKKSKKKGYTVTSDESQTDQADCSASQIVQQRIPLTLAALDFVETIFLYAYHSNPLRYTKILHDHVMDLLNTRKTGLYKEPLVRKSLFSAASAYAMYPHPMCPPSYAVIATAFQSELEDTHPMVAEACMRGLSTISFISANPNTANWSDVVRLKKECSKINLREEELLPSDHLPAGEESDESETREDNHEPAAQSDDNEAEESNADESEEEDVAEVEGVENVTENGVGTEDDVEDTDDDLDDDVEYIENDIDEDDVEDEEVIESDINEENDDDEDDLEDKTAENSDKESDCDENISRALNSEEDSGPDVEGRSDKENDESSLAHENVRSVEEDEDEPPILKSKKKRSNKQPDHRNSKRLKTGKSVSSSVSEMLTAFVDSDPDSDSD